MIYHSIAKYITEKNKWEQSFLSADKSFNAVKYYKLHPKPRYEVALKYNPDGTQIQTGIKTKK